MPGAPLKLFLIAGEPSGDRLGAALMAGLKILSPGVEFTGVGGPLMQAEGMTSLFPMEELSLMGLVEILPKYFDLMARIRQTAEAALASGAAALITIDSPDFCLRVAKRVKAVRPQMRTIHYVAPSVWAWRPGRAAKMAREIDHVLALLPFEPPYMTEAGMSCDFVGHPVVSEPLATEAETAVFAGQGPLLLTLPGSRRGEVDRMMSLFGQVLGLLQPQVPDLRVVLPTVAHVAERVRVLAADWPIAPQIVEDPGLKRGAFAAADAALAASGTVSLELAANACPMVIAYDTNRLTFWLAQRLVKVDSVTLVNLVSEIRAVPEFLGPKATAESIAPAVADLLAGDRAQDEAMRLTMERLGRGGEPPGLRAARSVLSHL